MASNQQTAIVQNKQTLTDLLYSKKFKEMLRSVSSRYMTEERIVKLALLATGRNPKLFNCTQRSVLQSIINAAEMGLEFGGQIGQGYLIPYKDQCTFIPGYQGFIELSYRSGRVDYIDAQLVHEKDTCEHQLGSNPFVRHVKYTDGDPGPVKFAYCVVQLQSSKISKVEIMTEKQLLAVKERSKAKDSGPWVTDPGEMRRKTVVRRAWKYIPKTREMEMAMEADNQQYDLPPIAELESAADLGSDAVRRRIEQQQQEPEPETAPQPEPAPERPGTNIF